MKGTGVTNMKGNGVINMKGTRVTNIKRWKTSIRRIGSPIAESGGNIERNLKNGKH